MSIVYTDSHIIKELEKVHPSESKKYSVEVG